MDSLHMFGFEVRAQSFSDCGRVNRLLSASRSTMSLSEAMLHPVLADCVCSYLGLEDLKTVALVCR